MDDEKEIENTEPMIDKIDSLQQDVPKKDQPLKDEIKL